MAAKSPPLFMKDPIVRRYDRGLVAVAMASRNVRMRGDDYACNREGAGNLARGGHALARRGPPSSIVQGAGGRRGARRERERLGEPRRARKLGRGRGQGGGRGPRSRRA